MVICLERGADLHMAQLMPLPLTVSCSSKIQIGFIFLVPAHPGSPGKRAVKRVCVCDLSYFDVILCPSSSQILTISFSRKPRPHKRSLGFPKSPAQKNPRSANGLSPIMTRSEAYCNVAQTPNIHQTAIKLR